jgi:hypothetical protein
VNPSAPRRKSPNSSNWSTNEREGGVDADEIAAQVHQGPAGIAGINAGIGLDEILIELKPYIGAVQAADDPGGHSLADLLRVADGEHEIPDLQAIGITEREFQQATGRLVRDAAGTASADRMKKKAPASKLGLGRRSLGGDGDTPPSDVKQANADRFRVTRSRQKSLNRFGARAV